MVEAIIIAVLFVVAAILGITLGRMFALVVELRDRLDNVRNVLRMEREHSNKLAREVKRIEEWMLNSNGVGYYTDDAMPARINSKPPCEV